MLWKSYPRSLSIALSEDDYQSVKSISTTDRRSMADVVRFFVSEGLKGIEDDTEPEASTVNTGTGFREAS